MKTMKTPAIKLSFFITLIFSLFILASCGTTGTIENPIPKSEEISVQTEENPQTEAAAQISTEETPQAQAEQKNDAQIEGNAEPQAEDTPAEKIDEAEILQDEIADGGQEEDFSEPEVQDAEIEEEIADLPADTENAEPQVTQTVIEEKQVATEPAEQSGITVAATEKQENETVSPSVQVAAQTETEEKTEEQTSALSENKATTDSADGTKDAPATAEVSNPAEITPSRSMTVKNNQYVDVVYPGSGWIYMGEQDEEKKFRYFGRKLGTENTTFTLRSIKSGKTLLHFYKNDVLNSGYIDDYLEVEVSGDSAKANEKATAPSYAQVVPKKQERKSAEPETKNTAQLEEKSDAAALPSASTKEDTTAEKNNENVLTTSSASKTAQSQESSAGTEQQTSKSLKTAKKDSSKSLLEQAKDSLKNGEYETALEEIREYLDTENTRIDEALYVQGQILEADSSVRNIKSAVDSYDAIIKRYPASRFWQQANKRKIYLNRYYVNIY